MSSKTDWFSDKILDFVRTGTFDPDPDGPLKVIVFRTTAPTETWTSTEVGTNKLTTSQDSNYGGAIVIGLDSSISDGPGSAGRETANTAELTLNPGGASGAYTITGWGVIDDDENLYYYKAQSVPVSTNDIVKFSIDGLTVRED